MDRPDQNRTDQGLQTISEQTGPKYPDQYQT